MPETALLNNRYKLENIIGSGGMAVVYRANDSMLERSVAIKVLREDFSQDSDFQERFRQEAKAAANLSHPSIVTIHDFGLDDGRFFIVMEFVPGTDLKSIMQKRGRFSIDEAISLIIQACAGIGYAHRAGLVHCDIKPHNILVTPDRRLKVADFGIARALATIRPDERANVVWGSPQYFSPEQAAGAAPSPASDVYSLGVVFYEMLTGRLPFIATSATELARMHREVHPTPPRMINPLIPPELDQLILKVLSKEPSARFRTADQMGRVLMNIQRTIAAPRMPGMNEDTPNVPIRPVPQPPPRETYVSRPISGPAPAPTQTQPAVDLEDERQPLENPLDIDWGTSALVLLALLSVLGLIPLWLWVYLLYYQ